MAILRRAQPAMRTRFEVILAGADEEHLAAVATLLFEEIDRVERLLSRFDPASEVARINRHPRGQACKMSVELREVLEQCRRWYDLTRGTFAVVARRGGGLRMGWEDVEIDTVDRTVTLHHEDITFDFGGYGKGYALDRAGEILRRYGIADALLHGGTSSILAMGRDRENDRPWRAAVGLGIVQQVVELTDLALSTSATVDEHNGPCEVIDPRSGGLIEGRRSCFVVAETAAIAEMASTAGLVLGKTMLGCGSEAAGRDELHRLRRVGWYEGEPGYERYITGGLQQR